MRVHLGTLVGIITCLFLVIALDWIPDVYSRFTCVHGLHNHFLSFPCHGFDPRYSSGHMGQHHHFCLFLLITLDFFSATVAMIERWEFFSNGCHDFTLDLFGTTVMISRWIFSATAAMIFRQRLPRLNIDSFFRHGCHDETHTDRYPDGPALVFGKKSICT